MHTLILYTEWTQKIQAKNAKRLVKAVMERPEGESLLTVCNHLSYLDDTAFYSKIVHAYTCTCI